MVFIDTETDLFRPIFALSVYHSLGISLQT